MKTHPQPHRRAFVALLPATLLIAAPVVAQEAAAPAAAPVQTTTAPPPVARTLPDAAPAQTAPAASAPAQSAASASTGTTARNGIGDPNSATPIDPGAIEQAEQERAQNRTASRAAPTRAARTARAAPAATPQRSNAAPRTAPAAAAPVVAAPAPVTTAPEAAPVPAAPTDIAPAPVAQAPAADTAAPAATDTAADTTTTTTTDQGTPIWPFIVGALVILGGLIAFLTMRRRRHAEDVYEEEYVAPVAQPAPVARRHEPAILRKAAPIAAAPLVAAPLAPAPLATHAPSDEPVVATEDATLVKPEAEDVEALTAGEAPVADRPWLEFAMRPVRAGSNVDEAMVEIELTVGNAGNIAAEDVRISTFMFTDGSASEAEVERLLIERGDDGVNPVTIEPGEGTRVDATLAMLKRDLGSDSFSPVVMADARYRLPDGTEGRTSATFTIGLSEEGGANFGPISIARPLMHEDIEARLQGRPDHA